MIAGCTKGQGRRAGSFGALVLAVNEAGGLRWAGNVGTGFDDAEIERLLGSAAAARSATSSPFAEVPKMPRVRKGDVVWVEPELVAEVAVRRVDARRPAARAGLPGAARGQGGGGGAPRAGADRRRRSARASRVLKLSNLDKPFWPEEGITKGDLLAYYRDVAPVLVPHLSDRPFTMKRYPDGWNGKFFFQKDAPKHMPDWIPTRPFEASTRDRPPQRRVIDFPLVNDELALLWMVNMGCIDMNTWYSRVDKPSRPDLVLFDLDPSPDVGFPETIQVALLIKETLDLLELESFPKTSGSEGIHILVPVARRHTYAQTREFSEIVAGALARAHPGPRDDGVDEGEAPRRPDRLEPERRGEDDRVGLLGPAEGRARRSRRRCAGTR